MKNFLKPLTKFKAAVHVPNWNHVFFVGTKHLVICPDMVYWADTAETTKFSQEAIAMLDGYNLPIDLWNTLAKAKSVKLFPEEDDKSEIKAEVLYDTYAVEVSFIRSDSEAYDYIRSFFRRFVATDFHSRECINLPLHILDAFLSVAEGMVYINPLKKGTTTLHLSDESGSRFVLAEPLLMETLFIGTNLEQSVGELSSASLEGSIESFLKTMAEYNVSITASIPDENKLF